MRIPGSALALVLTCLSVSPLVAQKVLRVPSQYKTIQAAADAAQEYDTILVAPGRYVENVVLRKPLTLKSEAGPAVTTIDGARKDTVVSCGYASTIEGFTITNGLSASRPGGIDAYEALIRDNVITRNEGVVGGIGPSGSGGRIEHNEITHNVATREGGGIGWPSSSCCHVYVTDNLIAHNTSRGPGGGVRFGFGSLSRNVIAKNSAATDGGGVYTVPYENYGFSSNVIWANQAGRNGGGICILHEGLLIENQTVVGNIAGEDGGGIWCVDVLELRLSDWILWNNKVLRGVGPEIWLGTYTSLAIQHSAVTNGKNGVYQQPQTKLHWGAGMITADPRFVDEANGDLHLSAASPCVDTGSRRTPMSGIDFEGNPRFALLALDMGADEFYPTLYVTGTPSPGQRFVVTAIGPPGAPALLGVSVNPRLRTTPVTLPGVGSLWLDAPLFIVGLSNVSARGLTTMPVFLPPAFPGGIDVPLQALIAQQMTQPHVLKVR